MAQSSAGGARWLLLGTDSGAGIFRARWDTNTGSLGVPELAVATARPTFLAAHPQLPVLYAANELGSGRGAVSSFSVERTSGRLSFVSQAPSHGENPCFVSLDPADAQSWWRTIPAELLPARY